MKIEKLIELLKEYPKETNVMIYDRSGHWMDLEKITVIYYDEEKIPTTILLDIN